MLEQRVFVPFQKTEYRYPEDMERIMSYLNSRGKVNVSEKMIERLYEDFSEQMYCAQWLIVSEEILNQRQKILRWYVLAAGNAKSNLMIFVMIVNISGLSISEQTKRAKIILS